MEPLWSPVVATDGNQWRIRSARKPQKQAKSVAVGCHQLPLAAHGKEGVDGSSSSEDLNRNPTNVEGFVLPALARCRRFAGTRRVHFGTGGHAIAKRKQDCDRESVSRQRGQRQPPVCRNFLGEWSRSSVSTALRLCRAASHAGVQPMNPGTYCPRLAGSTPAKVRKSFMRKEDPAGVSAGIHFGFCIR